MNNQNPIQNPIQNSNTNLENSLNTDLNLDINIDLNLEKHPDYELNSGDFSDLDTLDIDTEAPVYYSYPFYVLNDVDYQFKLSFQGNSLTIEEVKSNEMGNLELGEFEKVIKTIMEHNLEEGLKMISDKMDIRQSYEEAEPLEVDPQWGDILQLDLAKFKNDDAKSALENNKKIVLLDLYNYISSL